MERVSGYVSPDGSRKLDIFRKPNGLYQFEESAVELISEPDDEFCEDGTTYWICTHLSGLFDSSEAADAEAKTTLPWLREGKYLPN